MKKFFNWMLVLGACVGAVYLIGLIVPRNQTNSAKANLLAKPSEVYAAVAEFNAWGQWFPGIAAMREKPAKDGHPQWQATDKEAQNFELEVSALEEDKVVQCGYTIDETRYTVRFDLMWVGEGTRARVTTSSDTRDPWKRAQHFLLPSAEVSPVTVLDALSSQLGEQPCAEKAK